MDRCDRFRPYRVELCCPELRLPCGELVPLTEVAVERPVPPEQGAFTVRFSGLNLRYRVRERWTLREYDVVGQFRVEGLAPGRYEIELISPLNKACSWTLAIDIPPPFNWVTQLVYMDTWVPVPVAMSPFFMPLLTPNFQIRTNSDRLVMQPLELVLAFQVLVLGDFVPPVVTQFLDYRTVDPPPFLVAPGFPQQTPVIPAQGQRPPEIINMGISGPIIDFVDFFQVSLAPNNGNGWVYVNVSDSSPVPNVTEYWLYLAESILP